MAKIKSKKGGTPEHLDEVLRLRDVIDEDEYTRFWRGFNRIPEKDIDAREEYTDNWLADHSEEEEEEEDLGEPPPPPPESPIRRSKGWASRDSRVYGGVVTRVDRFGNPNPRGRSWRAI